MKLESPKVSIDKSAQEVFDYLTTIENFKTLMPENTSKFEVLDSCPHKNNTSNPRANIAL